MEISIRRTMVLYWNWAQAGMCSLPKIIQLGQPYEMRYSVIE